MRRPGAQTLGWGPIAKGESTLLLAPTGSGKTLAAFLVAIDRLLFGPARTEPGVRVLYVSPLKALAVDVEKNLAAPLAGISAAAAEQGVPFTRDPCGDSERRHDAERTCTHEAFATGHSHHDA